MSTAQRIVSDAHCEKRKNLCYQVFFLIILTHYFETPVSREQGHSKSRNMFPSNGDQDQAARNMLSDANIS